MASPSHTDSSPHFDIDDLLDKLNQCLDEKNGQIYIKFYVEAYDELYRLFLALGSLFGFVASDVKEKCDILRTFSQEIEHYSTVQGMMEYEKKEDIIKKNHKNGCRTLLRLHRAMPFVSRFLTRVHSASEDETLRHHGKESYDETLAKYHPWLIRKAVHVAVYALPNKRNLLDLLAGTTPERHEYVSNLAPSAVKKMEEIFDAVEALYDANGMLDLA